MLPLGGITAAELAALTGITGNSISFIDFFFRRQMREEEGVRLCEAETRKVAPLQTLRGGVGYVNDRMPSEWSPE